MELPHRLAMAPMTRDRSLTDGAPSELNVEYYRQRASMALIITEGTQPSDDGQGYLLTPGIYTDAHIAGWRKVTDAVHAEGGRIVVQLMHTGRISHPDNTPYQRTPVAPSAIQPKGVMFTTGGPQEMPVPRALTADEITVSSTSSATRRRRRPSPPGSTASRSTAPTATSSTSSSQPMPTTAPTSTAAPSPTASASPPR